jgi:hypothetical protein
MYNEDRALHTDSQVSNDVQFHKLFSEINNYINNINLIVTIILILINNNKIIIKTPTFI